MRKNPYAFKSKKMETQYQQLKSKFRISRAEFEEYYVNIRKANKKAQNLKRYGNALYRPHYSTEVYNIRTRQDFTLRQKSLRTVLSKNFRQIKNYELRQRLYGNLFYAYGGEAQVVINEIETMSDAEVNEFFDENDDLEFAFYDSDQNDVSMYLSTLGMTLDKWHNRINK